MSFKEQILSHINFPKFPAKNDAGNLVLMKERFERGAIEKEITVSWRLAPFLALTLDFDDGKGYYYAYTDSNNNLIFGSKLTA